MGNVECYHMQMQVKLLHNLSQIFPFLADFCDYFEQRKNRKSEHQAGDHFEDRPIGPKCQLKQNNIARRLINSKIIDQIDE